MDSYGHYAVDNGIPPYAGVKMISGTVVEFDAVTQRIVPRVNGSPVGVLAYDVEKDCTCTIATDGVVVTQVNGAAAVGAWVKCDGAGATSVAGTGPTIGRIVTEAKNRGVGIHSRVAVHLNILPETPSEP